MTIEELKNHIHEEMEKINNQLAEMNRQIEEFEKEKGEEKSSRKCSFKRDEPYYYMDSRGVILYDNFIPGNEVDCGRYLIGNCFKTEEEAEFAVEQLKVLAELREYADATHVWDGYECYYLIELKYDLLIIEDYYDYRHLPFKLYFSSKEQARKAIDAIGEDRLKKYYFCVED